MQTLNIIGMIRVDRGANENKRFVGSLYSYNFDTECR